jgi:hypothetical protein
VQTANSGGSELLISVLQVAHSHNCRYHSSLVAVATGRAPNFRLPFRRPYSVYPQFLVLCGDHPYDETDALAADVCASVKSRVDRFESDAELCSWLEEDGVRFDSDSLSAALRQLQQLGRIKRPIVEHSWADLPLPGVYVEPRVYSE